jgi:hypothetical protein
MPAFSFEKLTPPAAPTPPVVKERRGVIIQMLDRFAGMRARRILLFRHKTVSDSSRPEPQD